MHDLRAVRADPAKFDAEMARRGVERQAIRRVLELDDRHRLALTELQIWQAERNAISKEIGIWKRDGKDTSESQARVTQLRQDISSKETEVAAFERELHELLSSLPNVLDADVPDGPDETANVVLSQHGGPFDSGFYPRQHFELGEALGMMDFALAAKLAGSRFVVLRGALARLERALGQFMLDLHTREHGYTEYSVPLLANDQTMFGTTQLPKFAEDQFRTTDGRWLIPTAEVPLTNIVAGAVLNEKDLPLRETALTDCFRAEAGAAGRDTRGMMRQHQFRKVELVSITHPDQSDAEHERMTGCAETVLRLLDLPYRRVLLSSGDTGFASAKTYDLEVWLPGQQAWREISSCSNCRAFQARRMNARFRTPDGKGLALVHTLNGSGVAVGRALIAVMENHQRADGSIMIPEVLRPYMGGLERIQPC